IQRPPQGNGASAHRTGNQAHQKEAKEPPPASPPARDHPVAEVWKPLASASRIFSSICFSVNGLGTKNTPGWLAASCSATLSAYPDIKIMPSPGCESDIVEARSCPLP